MSKRHKQGRPRAGVVVDDPRARRARRRFEYSKQKYRPPVPRVPKRRLMTIIRGETRIQRCLREAREHVDRGRRWIPSAAQYGTPEHETKRRYDLAVHERFVANLKAAGIAVEGAET